MQDVSFHLSIKNVFCADGQQKKLSKTSSRESVRLVCFHSLFSIYTVTSFKYAAYHCSCKFLWFIPLWVRPKAKFGQNILISKKFPEKFLSGGTTITLLSTSNFMLFNRCTSYFCIGCE